VKPVLLKNRIQVAELCGVEKSTVDRWAGSGMPWRNGRYDVAEIIQWLRADGPWRPKAALPVSDDPLLGAGDSPALERYRLAKAQHAELDLELRKGELIEVIRCREMLARWAVCIRRMGEKLSKRFGNDAALAINESLAECRTIAESITREGGAVNE
jgi:phage terminase Nu1 subunit (DNA packaging protein)